MTRKAASPDAYTARRGHDPAQRQRMMNHSARVPRRARRARPPAARAAAAVIATGALALLAACSGSPSSTASAGSATSTSAVRYSRCIRSHGVPNYPDPGSGGGIPKGSAQHFGVSTSVLQAAQTGCQHLLPATGGSLTASSLQQCYLSDVCPQALVQQAVSEGLKFSRCMRSHGVARWPDPTIDSEGRPGFDIRVPRPAPRQVSTAINECERLQHAGSLLAWG
jgi:hypothetical protein